MISKLSLKLASESLLVSVSLCAATDDSEERAVLTLESFVNVGKGFTLYSGIYKKGQKFRLL